MLLVNELGFAFILHRLFCCAAVWFPGNPPTHQQYPWEMFPQTVPTWATPIGTVFPVQFPPWNFPNFRPGTLSEGQLSWVGMSGGKLVGGNCTRGNCERGHFLKTKCSLHTVVHVVCLFDLVML